MSSRVPVQIVYVMPEVQPADLDRFPVNRDAPCFEDERQAAHQIVYIGQIIVSLRALDEKVDDPLSGLTRAKLDTVTPISAQPKYQDLGTGTLTNVRACRQCGLKIMTPASEDDRPRGD